MHYEEHAPPPALAPWVATIWHLRSERTYSLRVIPDGCTDIIRGDVVGSLSTATGHSPKRLARIGRMQALLAASRGESWARTAAEFGYHDESHMINDVRRLADATPQALLADRARPAR